MQVAQSRPHTQQAGAGCRPRPAPARRHPRRLAVGPPRPLPATPGRHRHSPRGAAGRVPLAAGEHRHPPGGTGWCFICRGGRQRCAGRSHRRPLARAVHLGHSGQKGRPALPPPRRASYARSRAESALLEALNNEVEGGRSGIGCPEGRAYYVPFFGESRTGPSSSPEPRADFALGMR